MQQPTYWAGKFAAVFLALLPYFFFRVFFNGLPQQPETPSKTPSEAAVDMGEKGSAMKAVELEAKKVENATGKESKSKSSDESTESIEPVEPVESKPADSQPAEAGSASKDESQPVRPSSA